jgi:hypothetical protein
MRRSHLLSIAALVGLAACQATSLTEPLRRQRFTDAPGDSVQKITIIAATALPDDQSVVKVAPPTSDGLLQLRSARTLKRR